MCPSVGPTIEINILNRVELVKVVADLHLHSKYARGCSPRMEMASLARMAREKGIDLVGTGDFTHPQYLKEIEEITRKDGKTDTDSGFLRVGDIFFVPTVEVNNTFESPDGKKRRVHTLVLLPGLETVHLFNDRISSKTKLGVDGRPWVKMSLAEMTEIALSVHSQALIIPAHAWTPWFGIFGAKGGFENLKEAMEGDASHIHAIETGLSSDPAMNWRCSWLDEVQLVSFSDAHSPEKMGREATVLELEDMTYSQLFDAIAHKSKRKISLTYEFYPEEGKYHADGHRDCGVWMEPEETEKHKGICPKCGKKLTVGVLHRIAQLGDRPGGVKPKDAAPYENLVPLLEIVAMALDCGQPAEKAQKAYRALISAYGSEFNALHAKPDDLMKLQTLSPAHAKAISNALMRMQAHQLYIAPGFDGQFGVVSLEKPVHEA